MYVYEYTADEPRDFPTLGIRAQKGDRIESDKPLNSPHLVEIKDKKPKGSDA